MQKAISVRFGQRLLRGVVTCAIAAALSQANAVAQNPVVLENQNPGSSAWQISYNNMSLDATGQMQGYASAVSINKGDSINFYVSVNTPQTYTIDVFRAGYYQGLGARLMQHIGPLSGVKQASCPPDATTGLIACNWTLSYTLATQTSWTSGVYLALLTNAAGFQNYISFTLRDDTRVAALLYSQPVTTYQAYNDWPYDLKTGKSLYAFNSYGANTISAKGPSGWGGANAVKVSFDRPYGEIWGLSFTQDGAEFAFVRWMEMAGYDVTYVTDVDVHANPSLLLNYKGVLSSGHDEYWSKVRFQGVQAAIAGGINYAIFGQDTSGWQVRYEASASGAANRVVVCYRDQVIDPTTDPTLETVQWINPVLNIPGQTFSGLEYNGQLAYKTQYDGYAPFVVQNASHWIYSGSGFVNGTSVPGLVGYEADNYVTSFPTPGAAGTYTLLASSPFSTGSGPNLTQNAMAYQSPSGAWVFNSGTEGWSRGLDNFSGWGLVNAGIQITTSNILNKFIGAAGFSVGGTPTSQSVQQGNSTSYAIAITPSGGFSGSVTLTVSGLPTGATGTFTTNPATATSTLNVTTLATTPVGTSTLTITGVSGSLTKTGVVTLVVTAPTTPNFGVSATPASQNVTQGSAVSYPVTITPTGGFTGAVTLNVGGLPAGATAAFSINPATAASVMTITTLATTPVGSSTLTITGVSGTITQLTSVALVVSAPIPPSFTLGATPATQTVTQGGAASYPVTITTAGGFAGSVTLSVSGLPTGATGTFTTNPATATSTLNVTTLATTPTGTATITISGVSDALNASVNVALVVSPPGVAYDNKASSNFVFGATTVTTPAFTISSLPNRAAMVMLVLGSNTATNITAKVGGVAGTLVPGSDSGTAASIRSMIFQVINPPSGSQTATASWTGSATADLGVITATGVNQTTPVNGGVFSAATSSPLATTSVTIVSNAGDLTASGAYTTNSWLTPFTNQTLKWGVDSTEAGGDIGKGAGTTTHTWSDQYAGQTHAVSGANFVQAGSPAPSFTVGATPSTQTVAQGASVSYPVTITPVNGFTGSVTLTVAGLPAGATGTFTTNPATATSTLNVLTLATTPVGSSTLTITGVNGTITQTATVALVVSAPPNFAVGATPATQTVAQGAATSYPVTITPSGGFTGSVTLTVAGLPTGATGTFTTNPATATSTLNITTLSTTPTGTSTLTITGVSGSITQTTTVSLVVSVPASFTVGATPASQTVAEGSATSYPITITPSGGFTGAVTLTVAGLPTGATGTFTTNPATATSTLNVTTLAATPVGTSTLTITGVSGSITQTATVSLVVNATPSFTLGATPPTQTVAQGAAGSYPVTITPTNGFTGSVTLTVAGLPTGATGTFTTNPATATSTLNVTTIATTPVGTSTLTITGVSGTITQTTTVALVVSAGPSFTLGATPPTQTVAQGAAGSYPVTITPTNGFTGSVTLTVAGLPTGATGTFTTNPATATSALNVTTLATTPIGSSTLTITGVSGTITQTTTVALVVSAPPSFTLGATPASQTVIVGAGTAYPVTITPSGGFTGAVTLTVAGLPTDAVGTFTTNPATATSTLSITTAADTPVGSSILTITGVSGTITKTATVTLVVNAAPVPNFALGATPATQTVAEGAAVNYPVTITPSGGFTGAVTLTVAGLPTGATGTFTTNPATATSTLNVATLATTPVGSSLLTITGVSGSITQTATVTLVVSAPGSGKVVFDNKVTSGFKWGVTTVTTPAFTIGTGTNRAAMIFVAMSATTATNITAKLGGVAGTLVLGTDTTTTATNRTMIFEVINPPSGSQTATVTWTGSTNADVGVITVSGANQTTPVINGTFTATKAAAATTTSVVVTSAPGDLTASYAYTESAWVTPFTNQTLKLGVDSTEVGGDIGPGTGTTTHTWTDKYAGQIHSVSGADFAAAP